MALRLHSLRLLSLAVASLAAASAQTTVVRAQRLLDVRSGRIVSPAVLVVSGGTIEAVNPASPPPDAAVIDRWLSPVCPAGCAPLSPCAPERLPVRSMRPGRRHTASNSILSP
jgi:hypothetical protein